jgi:hypothetical protein
VEGCYRFDRPLGYSASGYAERDDSAWYDVELLAGGKAGRPTLRRATDRELWAPRSGWALRGDSLTIRLSTGLGGWDLAIVRVGDAYVGTAHYLTDALGGDPVTVAIRARRTPCPVERLPNER